MDTTTFILTATLVFFLKIGIDILLYFKTDAFNKGNKPYFIGMHLAEAMYWVLLYKIVLDAIRQDYIFLAFFGAGAVLSAFAQTWFKKKLDDKIHGQRKFFARITITDDSMVDIIIDELRLHNFELAITSNQLYTTGQIHTVITGSLEDRKRMNELKNILRNKTGFHLVIMRAEDIYFNQ